MTSELTVGNFKRIIEPVTFKELSTVNYFVGKNGSGKSSALNALTYLGDPRDASNSRHFFNANSVVQFSIDALGSKKTNKLSWNEKNPNKVDSVFDLKLLIMLQGEQPEMGVNGIFRSQVDYQESGQTKGTISFLNETLKLLEFPAIKAQRVINNDDPWDDDVGKRSFTQNGVVINPFMLAKGIQAFNDFRFLLQQLTEDSRHPEQADAIIVVLEEIENNLHPDLQKKIPTFISNLIASLGKDLRDKVQFFVSTHSPFLVGKAADLPGQKIYLMDEGLLKDLDGTSIRKSVGFSGSGCAWIVGHMLGAEVTDLGYPENYCIVEEYSLFVILEDCKRKGIVKNFQFISAGGESKVIELAERLNNFLQLDTLIKCNPYYYDKYLVVVDNTSGFNTKQKDRFNRIRAKLGPRFAELSNHSLEDYYPNIAPNIRSDFDKEFASLNGDESAQGRKKAEFASKVSSLINNAFEFSKLFNGELNLLLK